MREPRLWAIHQGTKHLWKRREVIRVRIIALHFVVSAFRCLSYILPFLLVHFDGGAWDAAVVSNPTGYHP